jgi:hypothetical protein
MPRPIKALSSLCNSCVIVPRKWRKNGEVLSRRKKAYNNKNI